MPIYTFTLKKYLKSTSTWVITIFSVVIIAFFLGTCLPFLLMNKDTKPTEYAIFVNAMVSGVVTFLALFSAVFAGFKAAQMYKDEVEEGTFLVVLSKPLTRSSIIFQKWLALFTLIFMYAFLNTLVYAIGISLFDKGGRTVVLQNGFEPLRSKIALVAVYIFLILFVVGLIFASIGILISTKLSVSATVGIATALGVVIPITGLVQTFTQKPEHKILANPQFEITNEILKRAPGFQGNPYEQIQKDVDTFKIYNLAASTGQSDAFKFAWFLDLSYQIGDMASIATDATLSSTAKALANAANTRQVDTTYKVTNTQQIDDTFQMLNKLASDFDIVDLTTHLSPRDTGAMFANGLLNISNQTETFTLSNKVYSTLSDLKNDSSIKKFDGLNDFLNSLQAPINGRRSVKLVQLKNLINALFTFDSNTHFNNLLTNDAVAQDPNFKAKQGVYDALFSEYGLLDSASSAITSFESTAYTFKNAIKNLESPLTGMLFSKDNVSSIDSKPSTTYDTWSADLKNQTELDHLNATLSTDDQTLVRNMLLTSAANDLKVVKGKPYVQPGGLLSVYAIVALILVPVTYLVMRRQDFR